MDNSNSSHVDYNRVDNVRQNQAVLYEAALFYANLINSTFICGFFSLFGCVSNSINMAIFLKIGFKDSINMSLFALAISDFGSCLFMFPGMIGLCPWVEDLGLPINWLHIAHAIGAWPHVAFTKITTLITAFITFERCLCVSMPLKVKTIITRGRTKGFLVSTFCIVGGLVAPLLYSNQLGWRFVEIQNRTILGLVFPKEREGIEKVVIPFINVVISIFSFIFIIISTIVLVVTLKKQTQWRLGASKSNTSSKLNENDKDRNTIPTKEQTISKMVVIISTLFIACLFPSVVLLVLLWTERRFDIGGSLNSLFVIMVAITYTLETMNAAMNVCIYYRNSSNYKAMFDLTFRSKSKN